MSLGYMLAVREFKWEETKKEGRALVVSCCFAAGFFIASSSSDVVVFIRLWGGERVIELGLQFEMPNKVLINAITDISGPGRSGGTFGFIHGRVVSTVHMTISEGLWYFSSRGRPGCPTRRMECHRSTRHSSFVGSRPAMGRQSQVMRESTFTSHPEYGTGGGEGEAENT